MSRPRCRCARFSARGIQVQLTARGNITIPFHKEVKLFADQVNLAVSIQLNGTLTGDQPQLRPGSNDVLLHRRIQLAFPRQDLGAPLHGLSLIRFHAMQFIFLHVMAARSADAVRFIIFNAGVHVTLGLDPYLLCASLVLKPQGVGIVHGTVFCAAHKAHLRRRSRQRPRRHARVVEHATGNDRTVRIAVDKVHHHLIAHARDLHPAVALARPRARHAHPAGAGVIAFRQTVPVELHLHATVFVRPDTLALRPHHFRRLRAVGARPRRGLRRTVHHRRRDDREIGPVYGFPLAAGVAVLFEVVTRRRHQILTVVAEERRVG